MARGYRAEVSEIRAATWADFDAVIALSGPEVHAEHVRQTEHNDFDPTLWFLVERDGGLVACALHWKESNDRGWVKDIAVLESARGKGLGTSLLRHALRTYGERGVKSVGLKVDSTNPTGAPRLYERIGFVTDQRLGIWIKRL